MVKERVGKLTLCISCLFLSIIFSATVKANTKTIGNFDYSYKINDDGNIWVTNILPLKGKDVSVLKIPSHIDEKKIVKLGNEQDNSDDVPSDNIFGMYRSENDGEIKPLNVSKQVQRIKKIILPKTVTELTPCCLTYIQNGKTINIPQGVKRNILFTYEKKTIWKKFSVSSKNPAYKVMNGVLVSKDGKKLYGVVEKKDKVVIPKKVQKIEMQVLSGIKTKELYIPASVKKIEPTALASKCQIRFHVAAANTHYATKENCIYSKKSGRLVAISCSSNTLTIPDKVTMISQMDILGKRPQKIIIPTSVKTFEDYCSTYYGWKITYVFKSMNPPKFKGVFGEKTKIFVPKGTKKKYMTKLKTVGTNIIVKEK